jgi:cell division protein FtsQ
MAKTSGGKKKDRTRQTLTRFVLWALVACFALSGIVWGAQQFEHFLVTDARFILPRPADDGQNGANLDDNPSLHIEGVTFASRAQILRVFASDLGRSVYELPLADRRKALLRVSWVKDATIVRLWPNRIAVRITERRPAAFIDIGTECVSRYSLIDGDGVILEPPDQPNRFDLPTVSGVRLGEKAADRGKRVRRMQTLLKDLGPLASDISQSDVSDLEDLKVTVKMQDRAIVLIVGDRNFHDRVQHFLDHYDDIRKRAPNMRVFDLRLDDRITAAPEVKSGC